MKLVAPIKGIPQKILHSLLSVSIFIKVLGVGILVSILFGAVALYEIRAGISRAHYRVRGREAISLAVSLSGHIANPLKTNDIDSVHAALNETLSMFPDVRYAVVQDPAGNIVSHGFTFPKEVPPDLFQQGGNLCSTCHGNVTYTDINTDLLEMPSELTVPVGEVREYRKSDGLILEAVVPIEPGELGSLRLGVGDTLIANEMARTYRALLAGLAVCAVLGVLLALLLAGIIVRPVRNLVQVTNRIRNGDLSARATVFSADEIGELATAFNHMTEGLDAYRQELQEQAAVRFSLIGKIVQAQEDERKAMARELHDQFGQTLSNILLTIEAIVRESPSQAERFQPLKFTIRKLIDDVRRMAWDARPSILDDYGVDHALARYVEEMSKRVQFPIDYQYAVPPGAPRLADQYEVTLYRIAQEAVTNIIRHAEPNRASIILMQDSHEVSLIIEDDGKGFNVQSLKHRSDLALGLIGMHERAAIVGGELDIDSKPGQGTTVRVRIPLNGVHDAHTLADS